MRKKSLLLSLFMMGAFAYAQENTSGIEISGSADAYYKYDFAKGENIGTYFANDHNSISFGMISLGLKKSTGKASFVGELSFGPRGQYQSLLNGDGESANESNTFHIQNLYMDYAFTEKFSMTAGFMGTFIGYEVISPAANFHYSTSYLFGAGPFQNAGIKGTYAFSDKVSLMAGLFNDWNEYKDLNGVSHFGAQLSLAPVDGLSVYANFLTGSSAGGKDEYSSGTIYDLVASYDFTEKFSLGLNAADYSFKTDGGYQGVALYPKYSITENVQIGARGEYFKFKDVGAVDGASVTSLTLSGKLTHGGLSLIPEFRFDSDDSKPFLKSDFTTATKSASQVSLALVYAF
ncbi:outer membrane beta-barrel protein [Sphingobacterium cavernae]|uniref:outer membrane beta-barrel protein n=1 Tax=Sphingobacterium cavernae TaxID=2592657 RepID=UPI00122FFC23|nr:outer membrane beta-barrel protein [Sphingobacterium cavernae]